jgi:hypothetical protein
MVGTIDFDQVPVEKSRAAYESLSKPDHELITMIPRLALAATAA